ncbi:hypothetical protein [Flavobacterium sp.]|uniref:hypothetical protein n=1 Tax=Flavobacterium sp. TaxID=239 RepID=UPI003D0986E0
MQSFKPFHFFLFGTSALLVAQNTHNLIFSIVFYFVALFMYVMALVKFYKEKNNK